MVEQLRSFAGEVTRVAREVGTDGRLGGQAVVPGVAGTWKDLTDNVNLLAANLTTQVRNIAEVTTAVARGDLSRKITVDVKGEILELKNTINTMVDQLNAFRVGSDARGARSGHRRPARRSGDRARRRRHLEGPHRHRERHGGQPHRAGARHRQGRDRGRERRPQAEPDREVEGRGGRARRNHQQHDRYARDLRRSGDHGGARSGRGRPSRRPGQRARRRRHLEGPHRQREPAGGEPDHAGARDRRSRDRGDQGRLDPVDSGRCARRGGRAQRQHQYDDRQPAAHHRAQHRAGLAEDQPRALHQHAAGPARPGDRRPPAAHRADAAGQRPAGRHLSDGKRRCAVAQAPVRLCRRRQPRSFADDASRRRADRSVRARQAAHPHFGHSGRGRFRSARRCSRRSRRT